MPLLGDQIARPHRPWKGPPGDAHEASIERLRDHLRRSYRSLNHQLTPMISSTVLLILPLTSAIRVQESPRPGRGVQVEPGIDVVEVVPGELSDARQPVAQCASMDV